MSEPLTTLPVPHNPALAAWALALNEAGYWAYVYDASWRLAFVTDELRLSWGDAGAVTVAPIGLHWWSTEAIAFRADKISGQWSNRQFQRERFLEVGGWLIANTPGGRDGLRELVDPEYVDLLDQLQPEQTPRVRTSLAPHFGFAGVNVGGANTFVRVDDDDGTIAGICMLLKPAAGMSQLAAAAAMADLSHLERMRLVENPDRRPAAILMADLEASSLLARHLSNAQYFAFGRRLIRAADSCIIENGGIVGRHAGDGVVAFFLAETCGSESAAARSCITAARSLRETLPDVTTRSDIAELELSLRFGLHWGATLYVGRILTGGRSEVTALGDEVNEAARIEACATGGRTLASKSLIERLNRDDADALHIDATHANYTQLADLDTATEKARRDTPSIAVCDI